MKMWVSVADYCRRTGQSRRFVIKQIEEGSIRAYKEFDDGHYKVEYETFEDILEKTYEKLEKIEEKLDKLSKHFGVVLPDNVLIIGPRRY